MQVDIDVICRHYPRFWAWERERECDIKQVSIWKQVAASWNVGNTGLKSFGIASSLSLPSFFKGALCSGSKLL